MRVALCLSGMPRSFKKTRDNLFKYVIDVHKPDIFISTWKSELLDEQFPETDSAEELIETFRPLKFDIEIYNAARQATFETNDFKSRSDQAGRSVSRMLPMFYKIFLADLHRGMYEQENQFTYDVVIRCRTDLHFTAPLPLEKPLPNVVYFPRVNSQNYVNDQFWYCDSKTSTELCNLYYAIPSLWHQGILIHGEILLYSYVVARNFTLSQIDAEYSIMR